MSLSSLLKKIHSQLSIFGAALKLLVHDQIVQPHLRPLILRNSVTHIAGPTKITYAKDDLIVLSVVRNGELYVKSFIEHYRALGVKHIVLLDNDSTDGTIAIARRYPNVTILQTKCPYQKYETLMKQYLVQRFSRQRWNLFADIDELFDYPYSDTLSLNGFLSYLNQHGYTAVVSQMLDLFSAQPLALLKSTPDDNLKRCYRFYDTSNIRQEPYPSDYGVLPNQMLTWNWGGIRKTLFDTDNCLTKAALTFIDDDIEVFVHCHQVRHARIADVTTVLRHYPFISSFYDKVREAVETNRYAVSASHEYEQYWQRLSHDPELHIKQPTAHILSSIQDLVDTGFLVVSEPYRQWAKQPRLTLAADMAELAGRPVSYLQHQGN